MSYDELYFLSRNSKESARAAMRASELERIQSRTRLENGTVLDIGCGLGELLELFPSSNWRRFGIEVSEVARAECAAKGVEFQLPAGGEWCDLVVLRGSLQHLDRPLETLRTAHSWLRAGGWLVVLATPNAGSPVYRMFQELPALDPPRNFVVFSDRILRQCLLNLGFREPTFEFPTLVRHTRVQSGIMHAFFCDCSAFGPRSRSGAT